MTVQARGRPSARQLTHATLRLGTRVLCARDPDLAAIVLRLGPPPLWARRPGFPTLVRIVLEQQVSLAAARRMYERLRSHTGPLTPEVISRLGVHGMRGLGFTRQKASYCHGLAESLRRGHLDLSAIARSADDTGRQTLLQQRGLGPWSVDIYYLMALRRPDIWPQGDLALEQAVSQVKRLRSRPGPPRLARMAAAWTPWRSVAARILWQHYLAASSVGRPFPGTRVRAGRASP